MENNGHSFRYIIFGKGGAIMSRVSEVSALQQKRIKEMTDRFKKEDISEQLKTQLMIQNMTQTLNDISLTLAMIADKK